jgi:cell division initiation protein
LNVEASFFLGDRFSEGGSGRQAGFPILPEETGWGDQKRRKGLMKISPLDIQQQKFRVRFRGFDMVEVDNFLDLLANEFEELIRENNHLREEDSRKMARIQELDSAEKELRNALVSVQKITEEIRENARKEGQLMLQDAKEQARRIIENAQSETLKIEGEIHHLRNQQAQFEASLRATIEMHWRLLESTAREGKSTSEHAEDQG